MNFTPPRFEGANVSPILFDQYQIDHTHHYTEEQIQQFVTMTLRARDWLRHRQTNLVRQNSQYWLPVYATFFCPWVNICIEQVLQHMMQPYIPKSVTDRLIFDVYCAINRNFGRIIDPFSKLPVDFQDPIERRPLYLSSTLV